jgi:hypothetical protein
LDTLRSIVRLISESKSGDESPHSKVALPPTQQRFDKVFPKKCEFE